MNRTQARHLLMPGIREKLSASTRLAPFTDEEIESAVDAYCDGGIDSAVARIGELCALPLSSRRQQAALAPLRSVSPAYRLSKLPVHFRSNQEKTYEPRKSVKAPACRAAQAGGAGRNGGAQAAVGNQLANLYANATTSAYYNNNLMQQQAAQAYLYQQMRNAAPYQNNGYGLAQQAGVGNNLFGAMGAYPYPWVNVQAAPTQPPKPLPVEIKAGELTAWRIWRMRLGGVLVSTAQEFEWREGVVVEGDIDAGYGVHAWKTEARAREMAKEYIGYGESVAIGTVELWGQVIEHDQGYRAQFGQIKKIVERTVLSHPRPNPYFVPNGATAPRKGFDPGVAWLCVSAGLMIGGGLAALGGLLFGAVLATIGLLMLATAGVAAIVA